ncbi:hypothetical protein JCM30237_11020 [Halolamina litorea]
MYCRNAERAVDPQAFRSLLLVPWYKSRYRLRFSTVDDAPRRDAALADVVLQKRRGRDVEPRSFRSLALASLPGPDPTGQLPHRTAPCPEPTLRAGRVVYGENAEGGI